MVVLGCGFGALAVLRWSMLEQGYETERVSAQVLESSFNSSVYGLPLLAVLLAWFSAAMTFVSPFAERRAPARWAALARRAALIGFIASGWLLVAWAIDTRLMALTLGFRFWVPVASAPFIGFAMLEGLKAAHPLVGRLESDSNRRIGIIQVSGVIFLLVLGMQSTLWLNLTERLTRATAQSNYACMSRKSLDWVDKTPLNHWGLASYAILLQGRAPRSLVLD